MVREGGEHIAGGHGRPHVQQRHACNSPQRRNCARKPPAPSRTCSCVPVLRVPPVVSDENSPCQCTRKSVGFHLKLVDAAHVSATCKCRLGPGMLRSLCVNGTHMEACSTAQGSFPSNISPLDSSLGLEGPPAMAGEDRGMRLGRRFAQKRCERPSSLRDGVRRRPRARAASCPCVSHVFGTKAEVPASIQ